MTKLLSIAGVVIIAAAISGSALAGKFEKSGSLKSGSTSFSFTVKHPKKIELYPESSQVKTSYRITCTKGTKVSRLSRSFTTPFTRNLLWHIPPRQDSCRVAVTSSTPTNRGQIVVDVTN
ncbi:MAG TPA: hypothetical protein VKB70_05010 [Gaiellaceae bacterium]|nr:hypothetical protein [Gaiellaceae bacterium]